MGGNIQAYLIHIPHTPDCVLIGTVVPVTVAVIEVHVPSITATTRQARRRPQPNAKKVDKININDFSMTPTFYKIIKALVN